MLTATTAIRRELLIRLVRAFDADSLDTELDRIPVKLRPKNDPSSRCCIYHDRAVLKYRLMSLLGVSPREETDEAKTLGQYWQEKAAAAETPAPAASAQPLSPLCVCEAACSGCPDSRVVSTESCRGGAARPGRYTGPKKAV